MRLRGQGAQLAWPVDGFGGGARSHRVALVGITGATDHWCVVYCITPKTLWLLDSAGRMRIHCSRCTVRSSQVRYSLVLGQILLIEQ